MCLDKTEYCAATRNTGKLLTVAVSAMGTRSSECNGSSKQTEPQTRSLTNTYRMSIIRVNIIHSPNVQRVADTCIKNREVGLMNCGYPRLRPQWVGRGKEVQVLIWLTCTIPCFLFCASCSKSTKASGLF